MRRLIATLALLSIGCGDGTGPVPSVAGQWEAEFVGDGRITLDLEQSGRTVTGSGTEEIAQGVFDLVVTGRVIGDEPDAPVTMTWDSEIGALMFDGNIVDDAQIIGNVTGGVSGSEQVIAVTLVRTD